MVEMLREKFDSRTIDKNELIAAKYKDYFTCDPFLFLRHPNNLTCDIWIEDEYDLAGLAKAE